MATHIIQERLEEPIDPQALIDFAAEVLTTNRSAKITAMRTGGGQRDDGPVTLTLTATWES